MLVEMILPIGLVGTVGASDGLLFGLDPTGGQDPPGFRVGRRTIGALSGVQWRGNNPAILFLNIFSSRVLTEKFFFTNKENIIE